MAHPYASSRQSKVEHSRAGTLTKGYAAGGAVVERARGGRTKGTNVNVIISPSSGQSAPPPPMPMAGPVAAPPMPPPRPPMAPPPGAGMVPPGGPPMPPGGPIRSTGGRTGYKSGGAVPGPAWKEGLRNGTKVTHGPGKMDGKDIGRPRVITYAKGGAVKRRAEGGEVEDQRKAMAPQQQEASKPTLPNPYNQPTRATGGAVEHPAKGGRAPHLPGGAGGGLARIAKQHRGKVGGKAI